MKFVGPQSGLAKGGKYDRSLNDNFSYIVFILSGAIFHESKVKGFSSQVFTSNDSFRVPG